MRVFLSYAVGPVEATIAARLRAVAAAYDIAILLPDRTMPHDNGVASESLKKIKQSDAVIGLMTTAADVSSVNVVIIELQAAYSAHKPIIVLAEKGVHVHDLPDSQVVQFNPLIPRMHEPALLAALETIKQQQQQKDFAALGWLAGITLGLIALSELAGDKK